MMRCPHPRHCLFEERYGAIVRQRDQLKAGFFCCDVAADSGSHGLLTAGPSAVALRQFYERLPDAIWQTPLRRLGSLLSRLET